MKGLTIKTTEQELLEYATKNLKIDLDQLPINIKQNLPNILTEHMNIWSKWFFTHQEMYALDNHETIFKEFHTFMFDKIQVFVENCTKQIQKNIEEDLNNQNSCPFTISITCPARMLNSIAFSSVGSKIRI